MKEYKISRVVFPTCSICGGEVGYAIEVEEDEENINEVYACSQGCIIEIESELKEQGFTKKG